MTKAELIEEVSRVVEMTRKDSEVIVEAIFDSVVKALRGGDKDAQLVDQRLAKQDVRLVIETRERASTISSDVATYWMARAIT